MRWMLIALLFLGCSAGQDVQWRYDDGSGDDDAGDDDAGDDDAGDDDDEEYEKLMWGEREGEEAWTGFFFADPDQGGVLCDIEFEIVEVVAAKDCPGCDAAFVLTRGPEEVWEDVGGACAGEGWTGLEGTSFGIGHAGETLYLDEGAGWGAVPDGEGEVFGDDFWFEIWFEE